MKRRGMRGIEQAEELNITAFLNLMVILVPFLLITAVFSRLTVLELNLPALDAKNDASEPIKLQLELVIRENSFDIQDANLGLIRTIKRASDDNTADNNTDKNSGVDNQWKQFTDAMVAIKVRFPDETSISLLLEPNIEYKTMIKVMDKVRLAKVVNGFNLETVVLFPNISIGDAQVLSATPLAENASVANAELVANDNATAKEK